MFTKYLNEKDKGEYRRRMALSANYEFTAKAIRAVTEAWLVSLYKEYKLDPNKEYQVNSETGQIKEVKPK